MASKMVWLPGEHDKTIQRPGLIKQVTKLEDQAGYVLNIVHPNTKKVLHEKKYKTESVDEILKIASKLVSTKFKDVETFYIAPTTVIRAPLGKMKLNT